MRRTSLAIKSCCLVEAPTPPQSTPIAYPIVAMLHTMEKCPDSYQLEFVVQIHRKVNRSKCLKKPKHQDPSFTMQQSGTKTNISPNKPTKITNKQNRSFGRAGIDSSRHSAPFQESPQSKCGWFMKRSSQARGREFESVRSPPFSPIRTGLLGVSSK